MEDSESGSLDAIDEDASGARSGLLPALFAFNVKSPTVDGLTDTGSSLRAGDSDGV